MSATALVRITVSEHGRICQ